MLKGVIFITKFCWKFSKKFIIFQFLSSILSALTPLILIIMPKYIIDGLLAKESFSNIILIVLSFVGIIFVLNSLIEILKSKAFINKNYAFKKMQLLITERMSDADFPNIESAEFLNSKEKAMKYLYANGKGFAVVFDEFADCISSIFKFVGVIGIIFTLNWKMSLVLIIIVFLSSIADSIYAKKMYKIDMEKINVERQNMYLNDIVSNFKYGKEIRIYRLKNWLLNWYDKVLSEMHAFYQKSMNNMLKNNLIKQFFNFVEQFIMYGYLVYEVIKNNLTIGSFTMYVGAISSFSGSLKSVMNNLVEINQYENYYQELDYFINIPDNMRKGNNHYIEKNKFNHEIRFDNVSFKYPNQDTYAIKNISFSIKKGENVSIVGENGSGKSTIIKLLLRLYDPSSGAIYLDNINIKELDYDEYMSIFSAVFQDYQLFATTIKENIAFKENVDSSKLDSALIDSGLSEKVKSLDKGINTNYLKIFDEKGVEFSGGQEQKLVLARAIYKDSSFIVLDEPTSALDPRSEYEMYNNFYNISKDKTTLFISHRLASCKMSDRIMVMKNGTLVEEGNHSELIEKRGVYYELFEMQSQNYK